MVASSKTIQIAAIAQLKSTSNKFLNIVNIAKCAGLATREKASMLFLPECFGYIGASSKDTLENAEPPLTIDALNENRDYFKSEKEKTVYNILSSIIQNQTESIIDNANDEEFTEALNEAVTPIDTSWPLLLFSLRSIAHRSGLWISGGGMHESGAPPAPDDATKKRVYNSHVIIDEKGQVRSIYRKIHLFDVSIPGRDIQLRESASTAPGHKLIVIDSPLGKLGLSTCYDVRFPEMYAELVQKGHAEILLVPSAFTVPTGQAHWHTLLRSRAIETQCFVLAAAQFGKHNLKRQSYGHALAIDPWGNVLADAGGFDSSDDVKLDVNNFVPKIITCHVDLHEIQNVREKIPLQKHRDAANFSF